MFFKFNEGNLYYELSEELSSGEPSLFLLPGGPGCDHTIYKGHSSELGDFACVLYIDPPGCGKSNNFKIENCTMENYIDSIEQLREYLKNENFSILGTSYGSMCAIGYAIKYPEYLNKLILVAGAASYRFIEQAKKNLEARGTDEQKRIAKDLWARTFKSNKHVNEFVRIMHPLYCLKANTLPPPNGVVFACDILNLGFTSFLNTFDYEPYLSEIHCKTLIISGSEDWVNDPKQAKLLAAKIPNSILHIFENCGHSIAIDQHEKYIKTIKEFIS